MRKLTTRKKIDELIQYLGKNIRSKTNIFFCSGTSIVYWGLRETSLDVDIMVEGKDTGTIIRDAKEKLNINIEPEHPGNFIPLLKQWRTRSPFIEQNGKCFFYHLDPYSVVLSKLSRGEKKDFSDIEAMIKAKKIFPGKLRELYSTSEYQDELKEYFAIDINKLSERVKKLL